MHQVIIHRDFDAWRTEARRLLALGVPPGDVLWTDTSEPLLPLEEQNDEVQHKAAATATVPAQFIDIARRAACYRDDQRWNLLYRILWRLTHGEKHLLAMASDEDVMRLMMMDRRVRIDSHKMTAFVRFRRIERTDAGGVEHFVAWHRPDHYIVPLTASFFARRFSVMRWSILTPDDSVHWDGRELTFTPGVPARQAPPGDSLEDLWRTYYASIFNPARVKVRAMKREMPVRHWATLPETDLIDQLLRDAPKRVEAMMATRTIPAEYPTAEAFMPARITLSTLESAAKGCQGCPLYKIGTQTVFGEGPRDAKLMFIGEQPGDQEDKAGRPFVGPAGKVFDDALAEVGIDRSGVYVTNAVKHFKWEPRGTRRIHSKPNAREVQACKPWLSAEMQVLKPQMVVCLGATAAQALMGKDFRITRDRGKVFQDTQYAPRLLATAHPSSILRMPDEAARRQAMKDFVSDLATVAKVMQSSG